MIGIDLGTTNSCVAVRDPFGGVTPVHVAVGPNPPYDTVLRSAVYDPCGKRAAIGGEAIKRFGEAPGDAPFLISFKPEFEEQRLRTTLLVEGFDGSGFDSTRVRPSRLFETQVGRSWSRKELVGATTALTQHLMREAVAAGGETERVLVGIPVSFSSTARKRLLCGMRHAHDRDGSPFFDTWGDLIARVCFVLEPVAVAAAPMRDAFDVADRETVLIFDHGGGTLDLTLVEYARPPGFNRPIPVRQLGAAGSDAVAGRAIDAAFQHGLLQNAAGHPLLRRMVPQTLSGLIEECKIDLSTQPQAELFGVPVTRDEFEAATAPVIDAIEQLVRWLLQRSDRSIEEVDRVVMSGGSSCVPCVQSRIRRMFGHLDSLHVSAPVPPDGVEAAITDVARGLVSFAGEVEEALEQVVLWDTDLLTSGATAFRRLVPRGTPFERGADGRLEVRRAAELEPAEVATSLAIFEDQLGHRFVTGLANVKRHPRGASIELILRPESAVPALRVLDHGGRVLASADLERSISERSLGDWFAHDVGALPLVDATGMRSVPLERLLRVGDVVEGIDVKGRRFHGKLNGMRHVPSGERFSMMPDFDCLPDLVLAIGPASHHRRVEYGGIRLAQKWAQP